MKRKERNCGCNCFKPHEYTIQTELKVTGIRPMAPVQNRDQLEDTLAQNVKFFGKERNYSK